MYAYILIIRMNLDTGKKYIDSFMDVSRFLTENYRNLVTKERTKARLKNIPFDDKNLLGDLSNVGYMQLRARANMADGPVVYRSDTPLSAEEIEKRVRKMNRNTYQRFLKENRI
jgi:hypothetical protein